MKFSIVITCFNNSRYLPLCLDSALRNISDDNGEIVCVDDCSTDDTLSVLEEYAKNNSSIRIVRHASNKGPNEARRNGVLAASGDYVLIMDPDDRLMDGVVDALEGKLAETSVDVVFFDFKFADGFDLDGCDGDDPKVRYYKQIQKGHLLATDKDSVLRAIYMAPPRLGVMVWGRAWRRELLLKAFSLIPEGWCLEAEDDCESLMFLALSETVSMIDYVGHEYRFDSGITNESMNQKMAVRYLRNALFMTRFVYAFESHFGGGHPYIAYLSMIRQNILNKYGEVCEYLRKVGADRADRLERFSSLDSSDLMWAMCLCEREAEWECRFKTIRSIRSLGLLMRMKRVWLKIRMLVAGDDETKKRLKSERAALKSARACLRDMSVG